MVIYLIQYSKRKCQAYIFSSWWRRQMEKNSALLPICAGNPSVPGEFPSQRPVRRSFDVFKKLYHCLRKKKYREPNKERFWHSANFVSLFESQFSWCWWHICESWHIFFIFARKNNNLILFSIKHSLLLLAFDLSLVKKCLRNYRMRCFCRVFLWIGDMINWHILEIELVDMIYTSLHSYRSSFLLCIHLL